MAIFFYIFLAVLATGTQAARTPDRNLLKEVEVFTGKTLETHEGYKVVVYPASNWVCTSKVFNVAEDPMKGWQDRFESGFAAMRYKLKVADRENAMFEKLREYLKGGNDASERFEMGAPITTFRNRIEMKPHMEKQEQCFWLGSASENGDLPNPLDKDVYLQHREAMECYVRTSKSFALSHDDWLEQKHALIEDLSDRPDVKMEQLELGGWYTAADQAAEVWIPTGKTVNDPAMESNSALIKSWVNWVLAKIGRTEL